MIESYGVDRERWKMESTLVGTFLVVPTSSPTFHSLVRSPESIYHNKGANHVQERSNHV